MTRRLRLEYQEWGSSSETWDFSYTCLVNDRVVPGGRFAFALLRPFFKEVDGRLPVSAYVGEYAIAVVVAFLIWLLICTLLFGRVE